MKHTPGPWKTTQAVAENTRGPIGHWEVSTDQLADSICVVQCVYKEANARLVASAPDLLNAVKLADTVLSAIVEAGTTKDLQIAFLALRDVIAKVEGSACLSMEEQTEEARIRG